MRGEKDRWTDRLQARIAILICSVIKYMYMCANNVSQKSGVQRKKEKHSHTHKQTATIILNESTRK